MVAAPSDLAGLDVAEEKRRLTAALAKLQKRGVVDLVWAEGGSWPVLQSMLLDGPWHVVHFIGHGGFDESERTGVLALEDDVTGRSSAVTARRFAHLLGASRPVPRLIVLNSCQSGEASANDLLSSTAAELVRSGTSAAVAMQFAITDRPRSLFPAVSTKRSRESLGRGSRPQWADRDRGHQCADARVAHACPLFPHGGHQPVRVKAAAPTETPDAEPDVGGSDIRLMYFRGLAAAQAEQWDVAVTLFDSVLIRDSDYEDAAAERDKGSRRHSNL